MKITFPDGNVKEFPQGTNGYEIAKSISHGLARNALGIVLNNNVKYELHSPINEDSTIKFVTFNDDEGKDFFWHSSAHLLAEALQELYPGVKFGIGPSIESGFYYDIDMPGEETLSSDDFPKIESKMKELAKLKSDFVMSKSTWEEAYEFYKEKGNEYKLDLLDGLKGQPITFCTQGNFKDLCRGGHIPNTGEIKAVKLLSTASAYWRGDSDNATLTRIYGITFPKASMLDEFLEMRAEAQRRDHKKLGPELGIYMISQKIGRGLPVWLPNGTILRRKLEGFIKEELLKRGYQEVITPHIGNLELYKTSGHYPYYSESQFAPMSVEEEEYMLKPMNCPHHHQIYSSEQRSYRDLPVRIAEFGTVYRYEQSGELNGMSRVRGFTQDDAHIYCTEEQLKDELINCIELTQLVFETFDMEVTTRLSFRDDQEGKYAGDEEGWEKSERVVKEVADQLELNYFIGLGEASFYGPKIDFIVRDAIGRKWQLGTVQVDYVMPERFELEYIGSDNAPHRPVIIHRAPFGSMERFISILIEHYAGNFPFWIAPVQVSVLPITDRQNDFAEKIVNSLLASGYRVKFDNRSEGVGRKIAESEQAKIPYALIIGDREQESETVSIRQHTKGDVGTGTITEIMELFAQLNQPGGEKEAEG
ncbi:MAG: threonine--tRNA ligase [Ignavibacteriae bacterium HGW-Ignavibacteriae-4]|jgi:threonyl-tRNA synthetase|nr:MAG: threonine--tRNA ligase [Ignavibacteriae bacterium HGW-Ignavibacteriae-4]